VTTFALWCLLIGVLLVGMGLTDTLRRELPFSASALYLLVGWLIGPQVGGLLDLDLDRVDDATLLEILTEVAVLVSLFAVGLRLRVRLGDPLWRTPALLASVAMMLTVAALVGVGLALGLSLGMAVLLGAVLAPTDPVLASDVQVEHAGDRDRLRFGLSGEGGLNDGTAFPFVMLGLGLLGLHELGPAGMRWWGVDLLWAVSGGLALGWSLGWGFARLVVHLRSQREQAFGMESFLTLGLIAVTYGLALTLATYGFLAVFAAGVAMRHAERADTGGDADPDLVADEAPETSARMAREVLDFTLDFERLAELTVMVLVGSLLLFVIRPLAVCITTWRSRLERNQRLMMAWFGMRGIGSLYYLAFAITHGASGPQLDAVADAVLVTIVASVLLHGTSATPAMRLYRRARGRRKRGGTSA
jgi:NhaP-type Na+/H+ or K+/H+ antiporter